MKFIWNEPKKSERGPQNAGNAFPETFWELAVLGWLRSQRVFFRDSREAVILDYNYVYHFFDLTVFEDEINGGKEPILKFREYLKISGLDFREMDTFRWNNNTQIRGIRFWIQAEDFPKEGARRLEAFPERTYL